MPPDRRFRPAGPEPLEPRAVLSSTVVIDFDTGADPFPAWPAGYGLPPVELPKGYLLPEWDARGPAVVPTAVGDTGGYGSHGGMMGGFAEAWAVTHGASVSVQPVIVGTMAGANSDAIGRGMLFAAAEAWAWPGVRFVAALPWTRGPMGLLERQGRKALARAGVPLFDAGYLPPLTGPFAALGSSGAAMMAAVNEAMHPTIFGLAVPRPHRFRR